MLINQKDKTKAGINNALGVIWQLEPRIMFDGAAISTAVEIADATIHEYQGSGTSWNNTQEISPAAKDLVNNQSDTEANTTSTSSNTNDLAAWLADYVAPSGPINEIVFVDTSVNHYAEILSGIDPNIQVVLLDSQQDGVEQIAKYLAQYPSAVDAIHLISHGDQGELRLGTGMLNLESMQSEYGDALSIINRALTENADFLIYGCNFGEGESGHEAATLLSQLTGADIAASNDLTGAAALGGDWVLETQIGTIETPVVIEKITQNAWQGLLATYTVTNNTGAGSLRQAITDANVNAVTDNIDFNIAGTGTHTITLASALPTITGTVILDATTDDSFSANGNKPAITLDGNNLNADGLSLNAGSGGSTIRGLVITNVQLRGIVINTGSDGNTIAGNYIGKLNSDGTAGTTTTGQSGIATFSSNNNIIGGSSAADRNVISASSTNAIYMSGGSGNHIVGNYFGADTSGNTAISSGNNQVYLLSGATGNFIGGSAAGEHNIFAGDGRGVYMTNVATGNNTIQGNWFGLGADGSTVLTKTTAPIEIVSGGANNVIGGSAAGQGNVIMGFAAGPGIWINGASSGTVIRGNFIGTDSTLTVAGGNLDGIWLGTDAHDNLIGGTGAGDGNVMAHQVNSGVYA